MYHSDFIINKLANDEILAKKLDAAVSGVKEQILDQSHRIQDGATRLVYYTSCFTENYQDVCAKLKREDVRFLESLQQLIKDRRIISDMIQIYVESLIKNRNQSQLHYIQRTLMKASVNISTSSLTTQSFALGITTSICLGFNIHTSFSQKIGKVSALAATGIGFYGYVQEAAESAERLQVLSPAYYYALYMRKLEMMYFLVEPLFMKAHSFSTNLTSDDEVAKTIIYMVR